MKRKRTLTSASESSETIKYVSLKGKERQDDDYDEDLQGVGGSKLTKGKLDVAGILSGGTGKWQAELVNFNLYITLFTFQFGCLFLVFLTNHYLHFSYSELVNI